jgi:rhamnose utilization protein RhaD (predicted bifunctional aldolase and dehydrogenase)
MNKDLTLLAELSAQLGRDESLVQGAGGNTSLKIGDVLWIKSSGAWLQDAGDKEIFVGLSLEDVHNTLSQESLDDEALKSIRPLGGSPLKPSIETPLHAFMPHPVVVHVHSVSVIAWAVREDAEAVLGKKLSGLAWGFVRYERPGVPLAIAVRHVLRDRPHLDVLVLGNHGLLVGGASMSAVRDLIATIESRLKSPSPRRPMSPARDLVSPPAGYTWSTDQWIKAPSFDDTMLQVAERGSLYPDHVVFLGPRARVVDDVGEIDGDRDVLIYVRGEGTLIRTGLSRGGVSMARCLGRVLAEIDPNATLRYLTGDDEAALMHWDAEKYRTQLDASRA